ncbi:Metallo-dependent hydrolase [Pluteus cervinus]|uniref:Metallo-dependent hydrolase n=1 Tax=Pluteus cervinus TaxID=181527 RepID=A0ACD3BJP4_9AGAR|nr:Metallo-dependent hydrolase [Pluteus cervinus]
MAPHPQVLQHVVDVHCHPTDAPFIAPESMERLNITICAMSSRQSDQVLVRNLAATYPTKVIPCFGYHPWFSHLISLGPSTIKEAHYRSLFLPVTPTPGHLAVFERLLPLLPEPISLDDVLSDIRNHFIEFPNAMLGEVGLDRSFHVAFDYYAEQREFTPFIIPLVHQLAILEAQIGLAIEFRRNVSLHSVKAHAATLDLLSKLQDYHGDAWNCINLDLHSCGVSPETWKTVEKRHPNVYLSLSTAINGRSPNHRALIAACASNRLLVESDYPDVDLCTERTWDMIRTVADIKGWSVEETWADEIEPDKWGAVRRIEANWITFSGVSHIEL